MNKHKNLYMLIELLTQYKFGKYNIYNIKVSKMCYVTHYKIKQNILVSININNNIDIDNENYK